MELDPKDPKENIVVGFMVIVQAGKPLNRQYDAQLVPYPSPYRAARQLNEPIFFLCGLRGLRGSKYKNQTPLIRYLFNKGNGEGIERFQSTEPTEGTKHRCMYTLNRLHFQNILFARDERIEHGCEENREKQA